MRSAAKYGAAAAAISGLMGVRAITAFACTSTPVLDLSTPSAAPGAVVSVTGTAFGAVNQVDSTVVLHWNRASGPVLATATADAGGNFGPTDVRVPATAEPGNYVIIGTGASDPARILSRAAIQVVSPSSAQSQPAPAQPAAPGGSGIGPGTMAAAGALGLGGLALFGLGAGSMVRTRRVPSEVRSRRS